MQHENSGGNSGDSNEKVFEILEKIYHSWTSVTHIDDIEYRNPGSRRQIRKSKRRLKEAKALNPTDPEITERIKEMEAVMEDAKAVIPRYTFRIAVSLVLSLSIIALFIYSVELYKMQPKSMDYEPGNWVTEKSGYITPVGFTKPEDMPEVGPKTYVPAGTQVKPLAEMGSQWVLVEIPSGQRGFLYFRLLKGYREVEAKEGAVVTQRRGAEKGDTLQQGTQALVVDYYTDKSSVVWVDYLKLRLPDGSVAWGKERQFERPFMKDLPEINQLFNYQTTPQALEKHAIGKPLQEVEERYGLATGLIRHKGELLAYFRHIIVVKDGTHHDGRLIMELDQDTLVKKIRLPEETETRFYDRIPLVRWMRNFEPGGRMQLGSYYDSDGGIQWWQNFKDIHWTTRIIGWIIGIIVGLILFFLFYSIPRIVVSPLFQFFMFTRVLGNGMVKLFNFFIFLAAMYLYFVYTVLVMDQWLIPAIGTIVAFIVWWKVHSKNLRYNRCPRCHTMYSAMDKGDTFTGRTRNVTWGTYDVYKGKTESRSSTQSVVTHHYERRDKKDVKVLDHYLDHRTCAVCGYQWDVAVTETREKYTRKY